MDTKLMWTDRGLIITHSGALTVVGLLNSIKTVFDSVQAECLCYVMLDFSAVAGIDLDAGEAEDISALVHDLGKFRGLDERNLYLAVVTADRGIEKMTRLMADRADLGIRMKVLTNREEALRWMGQAPPPPAVKWGPKLQSEVRKERAPRSCSH